MKVSVSIKDSEKYFDSYDDAMDYIETFIPEIEALNLSPDDIQINYHD